MSKQTELVKVRGQPVQQLRYGLDNPSFENRQEKYSLPLLLHVQTGTGAHIASNLMGTGVLLLRVKLTPPLLLVPRLRKSGDLFYIPVSLYAFLTCPRKLSITHQRMH